MLYYAALFVAIALACALVATGGLSAGIATSKLLLVLLLCCAMAMIVIARTARAVADEART